MQIDSGALLHLFDTLIIPVEKEIKTSSISKTENEPVLEMPKKVVSKKLTMIFTTAPDSEEEALLGKILAAIKIEPVETDKIISDNSKELLSSLNESSGVILSWGTAIIDDKKYHVVQNGPLKIIESDTISAIKSDNNLKAQLWNCLKMIFIP